MAEFNLPGDTQADVHPPCSSPDRLINALDIGRTVDAVKNSPYPFETCWGELTEQVHLHNPYYFTGQRLDANIPDGVTGLPKLALYHYRAREYDAMHGRFLQRDPLGNDDGQALAKYADGINLYQYVRGNPISAVDPFGLRSGSSYGPWVSDGPLEWKQQGCPFFFYQTAVSLPTVGWLGVILETAGAIYPATNSHCVDDDSFTSRWGPSALAGVTCYCGWKRSQPCKRCKTTSREVNGAYEFSQEWDPKTLSKGYAVTRGRMYTYTGIYYIL